MGKRLRLYHRPCPIIWKLGCGDMAALPPGRPCPAQMDYAPSGPRIESTTASLLGVAPWTTASRGKFLVSSATAKILGQKSTSMNLHTEALSTAQKKVLQQLGPIMT